MNGGECRHDNNDDSDNDGDDDGNSNNNNYTNNTTRIVIETRVLSNFFATSEKIRPWARELCVMRMKTIGCGRGGHPWWAQPLFVMIK